MVRNSIFKFHKNQLYDRKYDHYSYIWYRYHRLFFRSLIFRGRKLWAFNFFNELKYSLKVRENVEPFWVFLISLIKITPGLLLFPLKLGGVIQRVPLAIGERKRYTFAVKWVIKLLRDKYGFVNVSNVADNLIMAIYGKGLSIEKKIETYEISTYNRHLIRFFK